jgi:AraC-like DNA-binding protein
LVAARDAWLREIAPDQHFHRVVDLLEGVHFFAKNRRGETMLTSRSVLERLGLSDELELLGATDFELFPESIARNYVAEDAEVYETGEPILNRVQLWRDEYGVFDWYVVHKLPIWSRAGEIIGIMGILQSYRGKEDRARPFLEVASQVDYIRAHYREPIRVEDLAEGAGVSVRQLERRFKAAFGIGPQEFIIKTRVLEACRALRETRASLAQIALDHGFCDQSALTEHFKQHIGQTPAEFRRSASRIPSEGREGSST